MENPYRSPQAEPTPPASQPAIPGLRRTNWGVGHVRWVATLLVVHGVATSIAGMAMLGAAATMFVVFGQPDSRPPPATDVMMIGVIYAIMAVSLLIPGVLQIWAGIVNLTFRGYNLGMVALGCGGITIFSCICAPTGIALSIYGLIVYLQPEVHEAFQLAESGQNIEVILQSYK